MYNPYSYRVRSLWGTLPMEYSTNGVQSQSQVVALCSPSMIGQACVYDHGLRPWLGSGMVLTLPLILVERLAGSYISTLYCASEGFPGSSFTYSPCRVVSTLTLVRGTCPIPIVALAIG